MELRSKQISITLKKLQFKLDTTNCQQAEDSLIKKSRDAKTVARLVPMVTRLSPSFLQGFTLKTPNVRNQPVSVVDVLEIIGKTNFLLAGFLKVLSNFHTLVEFENCSKIINVQDLIRECILEKRSQKLKHVYKFIQYSRVVTLKLFHLQTLYLQYHKI